jgi:hypothetical protein
VCEEWFARLRPSLLRAAAAAGSPHLVYEHAARRLPDLLRLLAKVFTLLRPSPYCIHHPAVSIICCIHHPTASITLLHPSSAASITL